ncbi:MAG: EAL domain-containing protein [Leptospirales bacterium]
MIGWLFSSSGLAASIAREAAHSKPAFSMQEMFMKEGDSPLTIDQAIEKFKAGKFSSSNRRVLSFGFGSRPVWVHLSIFNPTGKNTIRQLRVEIAWIDHLNVYFLNNHHVIDSYNVGSSRPFRDRPVSDRFFSFNHEFSSGVTDVFIRAESINPIVLPISLLSPQEVLYREKLEGYGYGLMYGYLLAMTAYNFLLFIGLRIKVYLLYSVFMGGFIVANLAYTGHGFAWFWPEQVGVQRWITQTMMITTGIIGLMFAKEFLTIRSSFPRVNKVVTWLCTLPTLILVAAFIGDNVRYAFIDAYVFVPLFSLTMLVVGGMSLYDGNPFARYFLTASIASMVGAIITDLSVFLTFFPFNNLTYHAVDFGAIADATLLAMALSYQFRSTQLELKLTEIVASQDPLTGLFNRRVFKDRLEQSILRSGRSKARITVGILDLDGFKAVNDRLGHPKGDELLVLVARRLEGVLRKTDTLARLGGDEFGILLTEQVGEDRSDELFTKIVNSLQDPFDVENGFGEPVRISGSLGLTLFPPDEGDSNTLIAHADLALYRAKDRGRNCWAVFETEMVESLLDQHRVRMDFEQALRNAELFLYFQPQVNMETGQVVGAEALIRWNHPTRGFLVPSAFIGVIEKSDLIYPLGRWVLETALLQQKEWSRVGLLLNLSVNIGARHFLSDGFIDTLVEVLGKNERSEPLGIKIEVTETEALQDLEKACQVIDVCRELGVSVSLDDFGTGQASLASLQQLDVKEVKIDTSFVQRMLESSKDLAIVSSLSMAANMMLLEVVAEGVETEEEGKLLIQMGCLVGQGYAIAHPMPAAMIPDWVKEWKPFESWKKSASGKKNARKDITLLMVAQAMKVFLKGILSEFETPGMNQKDLVDSHAFIMGQWMDRVGKLHYGTTAEFDSLARIHNSLFSTVRESLSALERRDIKALECIKERLKDTGIAFDEALQKLESIEIG